MRKLVAALACRMQGSRLYGKPLQNLDIEQGVTILAHMIDLIQTMPSIDSTVLGISEGTANLVFINFAQERGLDYIIGDEKDVLQRLIQCCHKAQGTDIFRVTTESPFCYYEKIDEAWERHIQAGNDVTGVTGLPDGCGFNISTLECLERSHRLGNERHRSELCHLYIDEHPDDFQVEVLPVPPQLERSDLRLTVDYPEDLVLCRHVYAKLKHKAPRISVSEIIKFLDNNPQLKAMVEQYVPAGSRWQPTVSKIKGEKKPESQ